MKLIYIVMCRYNHNSGEAEIEACYTDKKEADDCADALNKQHGKVSYRYVVEEYILND